MRPGDYRHPRCFKDLTEIEKAERNEENPGPPLSGRKDAAMASWSRGGPRNQQPLMAADTFLHVIQENLPAGEPNRQRRNSSEMSQPDPKIINHLKDFSRQSKLDFRQIDISEPIENALLITGQQLLNHGIRVRKEFQPDLPQIRATPRS